MKSIYYKMIKYGGTLMRIGFAIYIIENFYFGWNELPMSQAEVYADNVTKFFIYGGFMTYTMPLFELYERKVKEL